MLVKVHTNFFFFFFSNLSVLLRIQLFSLEIDSKIKTTDDSPGVIGENLFCKACLCWRKRLLKRNTCACASGGYRKARRCFI